MKSRSLWSVSALALALALSGCEEPLTAPEAVVSATQRAALEIDFTSALPEYGPLGVALLDALDRVVPGLGESPITWVLRDQVRDLAYGLLVDDRTLTVDAHRAALATLTHFGGDGSELADLAALRLVLDEVELTFDGEI